MSFQHVDLFTNPRGDASRRLVELRELRTELGHQQRDAGIAHDNAARDDQEAAAMLRRLEDRAFALGEDGDFKAARARSTKAREAGLPNHAAHAVDTAQYLPARKTGKSRVRGAL